MVDRLSTFLTHHRVKRVTALLVFVGALVLLRHLATLLIFYLIFSRGLGFLSGKLEGWTRVTYKVWVAVMVVVLLGGVGAAGYAGVLRSLPFVTHFHEHQGRMQERLDALKESDLYKMIEARHIDPEKYGEQIKHLSHSLVQGARTTGRTLLHLVIGLILAILYLVERKEVDEVVAGIPTGSFLAYLMHYFQFTAEAVVLTIKVQVIVALVNAIITLPVMIALGLPHIPTLMLMVFAFGLVPVVGNFLSGGVLIILAFMKKGWLGVAIFLVSTVVLHKVESYYLNPRLTAKHVRLPSLLLIASLIVFEHLFGVVGVFLSFPFLYVALKIRGLYREVDAQAAGTPPPALEQVG
ncbi:MAG TPA: AI-2E family transporter [Polyangia bacterium]